MKPIAAVVFDLGNVLLPFNWDLAADRFCAVVNQTRREFDDYIVTMPFVHQLEIGKIEKGAFYRRMCADFGFAGSYSEFAEIWSDIFTVDEGMFGLAAVLKGRLPRYILSNTNPIHMDFVFERFPAVKDFDGHVLSHEVGCLKPDPLIYKLARERLGVPAEQVVFIDDIRANVEGAWAAGWQAIQHRDYASTRVELTKLGVAGI